MLANELNNELENSKVIAVKNDLEKNGAFVYLLAEVIDNEPQYTMMARFENGTVWRIVEVK